MELVLSLSALGVGTGANYTATSYIDASRVPIMSNDGLSDERKRQIEWEEWHRFQEEQYRQALRSRFQGRQQAQDNAPAFQSAPTTAAPPSGSSSAGSTVGLGCIVALGSMILFFVLVYMLGSCSSSGTPQSGVSPTEKSASVDSGESAVDEYYVVVNTLNVRLGPDQSAGVTNRLYRQNVVKVFEVKGDWARISHFYDGAVEGKPGKVARWVSVSGIGKSKPADIPQPSLSLDSRFSKSAFPKVGEYGMTEKDLKILVRGARKVLNDNKCQYIEYGDKSVDKPNTYYVNCGGNTNFFFTEADIK